MTSYSKDAVNREIAKDPREARAIHALLAGRSEPDEASMINAHKAGQAYWHHHRMLPGVDRVPVENLAGVARSCGWHGRDCEAWLAGFHGARVRDEP